ncbi:unnamed protein product [Hymenolepis diminuta]|uniref:Uncharacterized protein n=1 Tax=Hymenolepis diminuta TaxID=6216 RepID=A0A564YYF4_HYMDI|nr:unnamed protein product [Hymenolepis diminuta]
MKTCEACNTNGADRITCTRTVWEVRQITGRVVNKLEGMGKGLLSQSAIKIPAA